MPHGAWLPWLDTEFGWSDQQARRLMHVYEHRDEINKLLNLKVDVSALVLIATPSFPESVRGEVIRRAQSGERITVAGSRNAKPACRMGQWLSWLEMEFGWSTFTAESFMRIYQCSLKFENFSNLSIDVSALHECLRTSG